MPQEPLEQKPSWANASTEIAGWESPWSVSASPSSGGAENSEEAAAAGASFQRAVRRKFLVGAVGIEFIKAQNLKELCGMCCSRKSFVVLGWNYCCPGLPPRFDKQFHAVFFSGKIIRTTLLFAS